jgi:hypothetical protein
MQRIANAADDAADVWFMPDVDCASAPAAGWKLDFDQAVKPAQIGPFHSILARFGRDIRVVGVHEVNHSESRALFQGTITAWREERPRQDVNVRWALHGAPLESILNICKQGFVCVGNVQVANARVYGQGIYFTPCADHAHPSASAPLQGYCCQSVSLRVCVCMCVRARACACVRARVRSTRALSRH